MKERKDINEGLERFRATPNAVLVDVRNPSECKHGVIPGSINIPLNKLSEGWVIGKRYTYNISIGYDTITISPTVIGWENVNGDVAVN